MSTGFACHFVEPVEGEWFYVLQNWDCPVGAWDWREYATAYGPFASEDGPHEHLRRTQPNPGGHSIVTHDRYRADKVYEDLFADARARQDRERRERSGYGRAPWRP
jgi:hypothetical protein